MTTTISVGSIAPDFTLKDHQGNTVTLGSYRGKQPVLLIFYPGDDTPGCVKQLCAIRDDWNEFRDRNIAVFGVNHGSADSHLRFWEKYGLKTPLLIDEGMAVSAKYGATRSFIGKAIINRSVVFVDRDGIIRYMKRGLPKDSEIFAAVDAL